MKYSLEEPCISMLIDEYKTGAFGEDRFGVCRCSSCRKEIAPGESYFDVDGEFFCMGCREEAESLILEQIRDNYIFEC